MSRTKSNKPGGGKRKRDSATEGEEPQPKRKVPDPDVKPRAEQTEYDQAISKMDPTLLADHFAKAAKKFSQDESTIELEDKYLPSKAIHDTTAFTEPHVAKHLSAYLEQFTVRGKETLSACEEVSSPHTIVISPSGIRAADLTREMRVFSSEDSKIAKLFAKHMKIKEAVKFVEKTKFGIAVGTPTRLEQLVVQGSLKVEHLKRIVVDGSYIDEMKRTVFDMKEVFMPLLGFLNLEKIKSRFNEKDGIAILVF